MNLPKYHRLWHTVTAGMGVALIGVLALYWWSNTPPNRPRNVSNDAVWIWASKGPLPSPKAGKWITCFVSDMTSGVQCDVWEKSGKRVFSGPFLSHQARAYQRQQHLIIDLRVTGSLWASIDSKGTSIPIVYLRNEDILIPANEYSRILPWLRAPVRHERNPGAGREVPDRPHR